LLPQWLSSTGDDLPLDDLLADVGLHLVPQPASLPDFGWQLESTAPGTVMVGRTDRDGAAQRAGLLVGDELIALNGERLRQPDDLNLILPSGVGRSLPAQELLIARQGLMRTLVIEPGPPTVERWALESMVGPSAEALARRQAWLALQQ